MVTNKALWIIDSIRNEFSLIERRLRAVRAKQRNRMNKKGSKKRFKRDQDRVANFKRAAERNLQNPLRARVIEEVQRRCVLLGFQMEGRMLDGGADHWMFNDYHGRRLLNYWPTNGTFWDPKSCFRGKEMDVNSVLEMVETIMNERKRNEPVQVG